MKAISSFVITLQLSNISLSSTNAKHLFSFGVAPRSRAGSPHTIQHKLPSVLNPMTVPFILAELGSGTLKASSLVWSAFRSPNQRLTLNTSIGDGAACTFSKLKESPHDVATYIPCGSIQSLS
ncbi:hypothetical protein B0H19DRAFT_1149812 [Mycena capillaripes]|nr:hypothetical protein B0H19DRAFT_1149812 [Mycena capillaripes]